MPSAEISLSYQGRDIEIGTVIRNSLIILMFIGIGGGIKIRTT